MLARFRILNSVAKINKIISLAKTEARYHHGVSCRQSNYLKNFNVVRQIGSTIGNHWNEPMPGIDIAEMIKRRNNFLESIKDSGHGRKRQFNHLIVLPSSVKGNASISYLTGIIDKNVCLAFIYKSGNLQTVLFVRNGASNIEMISGQATLNQIQSALQINEIYTMDEMEPFLQGIMRNNQYKIWYEPSNFDHDINAIMHKMKTLSAVQGVGSPTDHVAEMRLYKSPAEVAIIKKSCDITSGAINKAMAASKPGVRSITIKSTIQEEMQGNRVDRTLVNLNTPSKCFNYEEDIIHVDAGCELQGYSAGISRTWPVGGNFFPPQKILYNAIYEMQQAIIKELSDSNGKNLCILTKRAYKHLAKYLHRISFMKNASASDILKVIPTLLKYPLLQITDMEQGDSKRITANCLITPGMVLALNPGIHIPEHRTDISQLYRGMSVQLQDNVLVHENGVEVLSNNCIESPADISRIIKDAKDLPPSYCESEQYKV